ncbi:MAG TPA: FecR family protein, partial [Exilispira sp.]|nr:FecR family protein [Exilispira sp.]
MFKKRVNISILICLIFVLFFATNSFVSGQAASQQPVPPPATGLVKVYIGDVQIAFGETASTAAPVFAKAQVNQELKAPTRIKTGKDSTIEILLQDKSVLKIGPGSDLLIETWNFDSQSKQKQGIFKLFTGKIMAFVSKLTGNSSFQIITNNGVASVRGTSFGVNVKEGPSGSLMDVLVFKGQVAVGPLGAIPSNFLNAG